MLYFILALLLVVLIALLIIKVQKSDDPKMIFTTIVLIGAVLFFTYVSKTIFVHKPTFILHLAFLILSWYGLFLYLIKSKLHYWMIFAPGVTTLFFLMMALFFRESG